VEAARYDGARIRAEERAMESAGARLWQVVARHAGSGRLAAMTCVFADPERPTLLYQGDTVVIREHRGRRLGMLLKTDMYEWMATAWPSAREVQTFNADSNQYMGAINEQLGFRVQARFRHWEIDVTAVPH
jgi:hypothetical protein